MEVRTSSPQECFGQASSQRNPESFQKVQGIRISSPGRLDTSSSNELPRLSARGRASAVVLN
eukprot:3521226-Karenia_brevis.AAC.1